MDTHIAPQEQATVLGDYYAYADRVGKGGAQDGAVVNLDDPVAALALLGFVGALELDQVWATGSLLAELEPAAGDLEVGVALPNLAAVLRAEGSACLQ
ncbi:MAG TPA: hypothetical protein VK730_10045 [Solirubrobacteraceae bacterium]|jgi:hypothetical protein|nr:hypothetical protein [Solirubrobacteraceae bacterium]